MRHAMDTLTKKRCKPCEGGMPPLTNAKADSLIRELDGWQRFDRLIGKTYHFKDFCETMAFVNAIAWVAHREDHHPELSVSYNSCQVEYTTHAIHGLSENDFICAAKVDMLFKI
ncbi:MAG: 4a-hydroxytetrahydrobiopterin dehydratase [Gallionella sp.]|nr:4a-hydroxytetrahydrobiopterin dehydratase [Gallionella sp.]